MLSPRKVRRPAPKAAILYGAVAADAAPDEQDVLVEVETARAALAALGFAPVILPVTLDLEAARQRLMHLRPVLVFNLVESLEGKGRLIHLAPALLESLGLPFTGSGADAAYVTSNKPLAKRLMRASGIATPAWAEPGQIPDFGGPYIVKSVWEHASIGIHDSSVVAERARLPALLRKRQRRHGGEWFIEAFIDGREFNLSLLAGENGVELLPPAEMCFVGISAGQAAHRQLRGQMGRSLLRISRHPAPLRFSAADHDLLARLEDTAKACWRLFGLRGYARIDCRIDASGEVHVLEVNINPCLSPDAGFAAAASRAGLDLTGVVARILADLNGWRRHQFWRRQARRNDCFGLSR